MIEMFVVRKKHIVWVLLGVLIVFTALWIAKENDKVEITEYEIKSERIPDSFNGFRIAQISDLHNTDNNERIINMLVAAEPDIIVITGDMIDSRFTNVERAVLFGESAAKIAPVYYVTGNHEGRAYADYEILRTGLLNVGITVLENETANVEKNGEYVTIVGLHDNRIDLTTDIGDLLNAVRPDTENYKILLAHRPEFFDKYSGVDLILSGHSHGGQVRLPYIGGLFAPGQGLFPKYDGGAYTENDKTMIVSRGLGNSLFPFRVNNNPEVVVTILQRG